MGQTHDQILRDPQACQPWSQQSMADSCGASKKTVDRVLKRAKEINLYWPLDENETEAVIAEKRFCYHQVIVFA